MSHSAPSDSSPFDTSLDDIPLVLGPDLVAFDRPDLPIYANPNSLWAQAGHEAPHYGASLDRLFAAGEGFVETVPLIEEPREIAAAPDDPLVALPGLSDAIVLPSCEPPGIDTPHHDAVAASASVYDFAADSHALLPHHDGMGWDLAKPEWFYDHHI